MIRGLCRSRSVGSSLLMLVPFVGGCAATYKGVVRPVTRLSVLSPELENLNDFKIETYLTADARPVFPTTLAIAKVLLRHAPRYSVAGTPPDVELEVLGGDEAEGWRNMARLRTESGETVLEQVQLVSPLIVSSPVTLKALRDAAALLHAPLLFVYLQDEDGAEGYNDAAMAYWTFVGLFVVPGNTVGHYSVCQGVLLDTRSGFILATAEGESRREENVLPGAVPIARDRVDRRARAEAVISLQKDFRETLVSLAVARGAPRE